MEVIFNRRSIRKYEDRPVEQEKIEKLLRAAMQAPSAVNQQPWEFIVVQNKEKLKQIAAMGPYAKMVESAAVAIVAVANRNEYKIPTSWQQDMGAAVQNLLLEAAALELGAVWLGVATAKEHSDYIQEIFKLPDSIQPFAIIPVGYPAAGQNNIFIDRFNASKVHYEEW
jgi:nitroreductase